MLLDVRSVVKPVYKCSRVHARQKEISQATMEAEPIPANVDLSTYSCIVAQGGDKVYKDECVFCFNSPVDSGGLNVCLSTLYGVCHQHLKLHVKNRRKNVFLNLMKIEKKVDQCDDPPEKKPTKMAIGVEGGFDVEKNKIEYDDANSLIVTDLNGNITDQTSLPNPNLPLTVQLSIAAVLTHQGASLQDDIQAWEEKRDISKYAENLQQLDNGVKVPPSGWKCSRCDLTQNLWLNLTDGTILCGRRYYDGSGGNNHAVEYYNETKYPLAVKLGTITGDGGDVYSYPEDNMVIDPKLKEHLQHFGINITQMEKTDKTMTELEIEANLTLKAEWDTIQESGKKLTPLFGPGNTGMFNLGNSCYMNSIMQVLFSTKEFEAAYFHSRDQILDSVGNSDPTKELQVQMSKLADGLLSGHYSQPPADETCEPLGIRPQMFKSLVGRGHVDFSTNQQQDAQEYFLHLMDLLEKTTSLKELFEFQFEDRIQCLTSKKVSYITHNDIVIGLPIPLEAATNKQEHEAFEKRKKEAEQANERLRSEDVVRLNIPMGACWEQFMGEEIVTDFYSNAIKRKSNAIKTVRFKTFPEYLVVQLRKFTISEDWTPKKLDVTVDVLEELDLSYLRSTGKQPHEEEQPASEEDGQAQEVSLNEEYIAQLVDMGFPLDACKRAVHSTNNSGIEAAMNWVFEHSQDPDFAAPFEVISSKGSGKSEAKYEDISQIVALGFNEIQARNALLKFKNNLEQALEFLFEHPGEVSATELNTPSDTQENRETKCKDGPAKYCLFAFVSHMGTSTSCGHYVCHIKKDGKWVIFNDRKVALSEEPPKNLGYLYFYKRVAGAS